jgi:hypothetical protein
LSDNGCCAIRPPEALRAANRKTGISMPENQKQTPFRRAPCVLVTLRLSTHQPTSRPCRVYLPFRPLPELENTAIQRGFHPFDVFTALDVITKDPIPTACKHV